METLREKLGPLPVYGWLILLTVAGGAWWLIARRKGAQPAPTPQAAANDVPQTVIQTSVPISVQDEDGDRERQRKSKAHRHKPGREESRESDKAEDREHQARIGNRDRENREAHRPYHPPHGPAPTNHNPRQPQAT